MMMPTLFWFRDVAFFNCSVVVIILLRETGEDFLPILFLSVNVTCTWVEVQNFQNPELENFKF